MSMLNGIKVIDLTTVIFGPYATQMLADMGAEVIKVETPDIGDVSRYLGSGKDGDATMGSIHLTVNRGKQSIALDLKKPEDADVLRALLADADVFVHNVRAKAIERLGFSYEAVKALKPDIIYMHAAGFGQDGPYADLQAYDDVIQAATGTASLLPRVDGNDRPRYLPSLIADKVAGLYGAQAILAAIVHKLRTGEGQAIEVPMFECFTSFMMTEHLRDATLVPPIGPAGYPRQLDPTRQPFPTQDGYMSIVPYTAESMVRILGVIDSNELMATPEFAKAYEDGTVFSLVYTEIAKKTPQRSTAEWMEVFAANDIPAMPARDLADVPDDPHLQAIGYFQQRDHPVVGPFLESRAPIKFSARPHQPAGFAPRIDQDGPRLRAEIANGSTS
jgi:crotonobetainyl-CoA:carnitine CoA-transferase CaiB-like acyl-CoA transferase